MSPISHSVSPVRFLSRSHLPSKQSTQYAVWSEVVHLSRSNAQSTLFQDSYLACRKSSVWASAMPLIQNPTSGFQRQNFPPASVLDCNDSDGISKDLMRSHMSIWGIIPTVNHFPPTVNNGHEGNCRGRVFIALDFIQCNYTVGNYTVGKRSECSRILRIVRIFNMKLPSCNSRHERGTRSYENDWDTPRRVQNAPTFGYSSFEHRSETKPFIFQ